MDLGTAVSHIRMEIKVKPKSVIIVLKILFFIQEISIITSPYPDLDNCITQNQKEGISSWKNSVNLD